MESETETGHKPVKSKISTRAKRQIAFSAISLVVVIGALTVAKQSMPLLVERTQALISKRMLLSDVFFNETQKTNLSARINKLDLLKLSGLQTGQETLAVDLKVLEERLLSSPWIESVQIQKKLPSTISIGYVPYQARALVSHKGKLWLLSPQGRRIAPDSNVDLPVLSSDSHVEVQLQWLELLEAQAFRVDEIQYSAEKSRLAILLVVRYASQSLKTVVYVNTQPDAQAVVRLKRVVQYLIKNNILVSTIDLRPGKKVVVNVGKRP